ncbi:MAG: pyridoxamine 5'-phosphate oxidase family protein, partial [Actinobacteria bacterium]|nr:pyridoxamine 5'-phosphate oxidase family protein [Actinomycetota bacterium]
MAQLSEVHALDSAGRAECLRLLRTGSVGRIVFTEQALPAIQPVNFTIEG